MTSLPRLATVAGAVLGGLSVAFGAFGAHALAAVLEATGRAAAWETAARMCMHHALALLAVGLAATVRPGLPGLGAAAGCFLAGTLVFSGCLAALAVTGITVLGAVVPVGGVLLIAGWAALARAAWRIAG